MCTRTESTCILNEKNEEPNDTKIRKMFLKNHIVCKLETILNRHDIIEAKTDLIVYLMTFFTLIVICNLKDYCPLCKRIKLTKGGDVSTFFKTMS